MAIVFADGWDDQDNHTSGRSQQEVQAIIEEVATLSLAHDQSGGAMGIALAMNVPICVKKGIHDDSRGKHITIEFATLGTSRTFHLYLEKVKDSGGKTFIWRAAELR